MKIGLNASWHGDFQKKYTNAWNLIGNGGIATAAMFLKVAKSVRETVMSNPESKF